MLTKIKISFFIVALLVSIFLPAQNFSHQQNVVEFLSRMAQKGKIELFDLMKPLERDKIYTLLSQLQSQNNLTTLEKNEISFYIQLYQFDNLNSTIAGQSFSYPTHQPKYGAPVFSYVDKDFRVMADPQLEITKSIYDKKSTLLSSGFQLMGYAGKRVGFQIAYRDINETGNFDSIRIANNLPGINRKQSTSNNLLNYAQLNATISYKLNKGLITVGQDQQVIGYGKMGDIVLSDKSPSYPFFKIKYEPTKWLAFNYLHAWLQSGILDPSKSYALGNTVYGGERLQYIPKFYATHFVELKLMKGLFANAGESIVYTDKLELPYLIPISFFKAFDNSKFGDNISSGANGQLFMGFSSRNQLPNSHLYAQVFIDEIRVSSIFNETKSRNQWAYQLGASVTDVYFPGLTLNAEYTRVNPFVYQNFIPAQNYTNANYALGDWIGANSDRTYLSAFYKPNAKIGLKGFYMYSAKGWGGSVEQQYFAEPQPKFGFAPQYKLIQMGVEGYYQLYNNIQFKFSHVNMAQRPYLQVSKANTITSIGFCWSSF